MQQNFRQSLGAAVAWDANSKYQICNVYGNFGAFLYQYVPLVTNSGNLYQLNGTALNNGTPPASDPAYVQLGAGGGGGGMTPLPDGQIYVGNSSNIATAVAMSGDVTISNTGETFITDATVTGKDLTGFTSTTGTITESDTILSGIEKLDGNIQATTQDITLAIEGLTTLISSNTPGVAFNYVITKAPESPTPGTIGCIIKCMIYDTTNFMALSNNVSSFEYTLPPLPAEISISILGSANIAFFSAELGGSTTGGISTWFVGQPGINTVTVAALNTTGNVTADGILTTEITYIGSATSL